MADQPSTCEQVLKWNRRLHAVHGRPHDHICWLESGHPVSEGVGVQIHECGTCTIAWESDRRPSRFCRCAVETNPNCPIHGTDTS
jgi:hypothetical protein